MSLTIQLFFFIPLDICVYRIHTQIRLNKYKHTYADESMHIAVAYVYMDGSIRMSGVIFKKIKEELRIEIRTLCVLQKAKQNYRQIDFDRAV